MRRSVGSGPIPQAETAAAPAPVTPRTFKNRLRSMGSVISVMAHAAFAADLVLDVAAHAPSHLQGRDLGNLRHGLHIAVARRTGGVRIDAQPGAKSLDVAHVREAREPGQRVNPDPLGRLSLAPRVADLLDLRLVRRRRAADQLVTSDARLQRRNPRLARD